MVKFFSKIWMMLRHLFERILIAFWRRVAPVKTPQPGYSTTLADNLQMHMNLVMPLADQTPVGRARAAAAIAANIDELFTGLSNVGTVHFARFDLIGGNLCMYSVFDGDFRAYIRDFICAFGSVFDSLLGLVADPPPSPSAQNPEAFIDWIHRHDSFQIPRDLTSLFPEEKNINNLSRDLVLLLDENPNVQLGRFSGYPGVSVAQIRHNSGLGW
ncbi:MAG: hypothetical protein K2P70_15830 [Hyphomonadaceae bacterium]|nr:hypothetical protein [Hyphomonadaceae bacterium]